MKKILRQFFINFLSLLATNSWFPGLKLKGSFLDWLLVALILTLLNKIFKPILKLIFLPVNFITLGLFGWVIDVLALLALTLIIDKVAIVAFRFQGFSVGAISISSFNVSYILSLILASFILNIIRRIIRWLTK